MVASEPAYFTGKKKEREIERGRETGMREKNKRNERKRKKRKKN